MPRTRQPLANISPPTPVAAQLITPAANSQTWHRPLQFASVLRFLLFESVSSLQLETAPALLLEHAPTGCSRVSARSPQIPRVAQKRAPAASAPRVIAPQCAPLKDPATALV